MREHLLLLLIAISILSCGPSSEQLKCTQSGEFEICTPNNWNHVETDKAIFFSGLSDSIRNTFAIMQSLDLDWSTEEYILELNRQLTEDTIEVFTGYTLQRMQIDDIPTNTYYVQIDTKLDNQEYRAFGMVWRDDSHLNEFMIKRLATDFETGYKELSQVIFNLKSDGQSVFDRETELEYELTSFEELAREKSP